MMPGCSRNENTFQIFFSTTYVVTVVHVWDTRKFIFDHYVSASLKVSEPITKHILYLTETLSGTGG